ncbi:hypothetical protein FSPOR_520 [Fusarium sporotrichioides]|uniref:Apple domain-containing protein n=1 Tax=Fusarium sporotrichioides TaxID=5514 RepID=A0A395SUJ0_FUSSP|nr:hypothetical protein FSPOR_520 [Fusarium sporotrichioides]
MSRHLVRSFILAAVLSPFVTAGPCKPSSSSTVLGPTTTESTEVGAATSSDVVVSTSETATVSESVLFTTTAETSAVIPSDETAVSQSETVTTEISEASTTVVSQSQPDTTTAFGDITTTILESSTIDEEVLPTTTETSAALSTDITIATSETELPTTTTTEEVTLTSTEPAETTTEAPPVCIDNKLSPSPKGVVCGIMGSSSGSSGGTLIANGRSGSEFQCAEDCKNNANCKFIAVWVGSFCELWSGVVTPASGQTSWKWYEPECFCGFPEPEPEATQTAP